MTTGEQPNSKKVVNRAGSEPLHALGPNVSYPFAVVALVAGVVSLFVNLFLIPSLVAVIFGIVGIRHSRSHRTAEGARPGFGISVAALVLAAVGAIAYIVVLAINLAEF